MAMTNSSMSPAKASKALHVGIVGAGFAGLRAADVLLRHGARVTIFEARNRIGGRVHQAMNGAHLVDLGPNWIHGTQGNPIMKLAEKTRSIYIGTEERRAVFDSDGNPKTETESTELATEMWTTIADAYKYSEDHSKEIDVQASLIDFFKQELYKRFPDQPDKVAEVLKEAALWGFFIGSPVESQSLRNFFLEQSLEGENVFLASTYKYIAKEVASMAVQKAELNLRSEVISILYRQDGDLTSSVSLTTSDGTSHQFDEAVVTCPLGWLKENMSVFSPALPSRLAQAIENIGYGNLEKLIVSFPSAFWLQHKSDSASSFPITGGFADVAANGHGDGQSGPLFSHFHHPTYHPNPLSRISHTWNETVVSMASLPSSTAHPSLLMYVHGDAGKYLTSTLANHEEHSSVYNKILLDFAEPYFSHLPGYDATKTDCIPTLFLLSQWSNDKFAGYGSYSNFQVGLEAGDEDIVCMRTADGLSKAGRGLWLAGEHVAPFVAVGTTTGAYWSGEAVASQIAQRYSLDPIADEEDS